LKAAAPITVDSCEVAKRVVFEREIKKKLVEID